MRNLKRVLSLALAAMMLIGMMVITSSAAEVTKISFDDADEIQNTEAVDVMVALGVLKGDAESSTFRPDSILSREEAATIICNMLIGSENAEKLTATTDVFTDVPASWWSAKYIAYCVNLGIISGNGDGTFDPQGQLTGTAFGKMMLVVLGYDAKVQNYLGNPNWESLVVSDMLDAGIAVNGINASEPLNRDNAAQMAFQTLTADMVKYANKGSQIIIGDAQVINTPSAAEKVTAPEDEEGYDGKPDGIRQFCEKYFPDLEKSEVAADALGRPSYTWAFDGTDIATYAAAAQYTLNGSFSGKDLYKALGSSLAKSTGYDWYVFMDGSEDISAANNKAPNVAKLKDDTKNNTDSTAGKIGGNGTVTEIFVDKDSKEISICIMNTYLAQVSGDFDEKDKELDITLLSDDPADGGTETTLKQDDFANLASFVDDDYVLVTIAIDDDDSTGTVQSIAMAETVTGTVTGYTSEKSVTVDGAKYEYSAKRVKAGDPSDINKTTFTINDEQMLILDANGYIIGLGDANTSSNYVMLYGFDTQGTFSTSKIIADAYFTDGSHEIITVGRVDGVNITGSNASTKKTELNSTGKGWYTYTTGSNGEYRVKACDHRSGGEVTPTTATEVNPSYIKAATTNGSTTLGAGSLKATNATIFVVLYDGSVKTYTGLRNVPDITATSTWNTETNKAVGSETFLYAAPSTGSTYAAYVFVDAGIARPKSGSTSASDIIYVLKDNGDNSVNSDGDGYVTYDAIVNGSKTKIDVSSTCDEVTGRGLYVDVTYDSNNFVDSAKKITEATDDDSLSNRGSEYMFDKLDADKAVTAGGDVVTVGTIEYLLDEGVNVRVIDGTDVTVRTAARFADLYGTGTNNSLNGATITAVLEDGVVIYLFVDVTAEGGSNNPGGPSGPSGPSGEETVTVAKDPAVDTAIDTIKKEQGYESFDVTVPEAAEKDGSVVIEVEGLKENDIAKIGYTLTTNARAGTEYVYSTPAKADGTATATIPADAVTDAGADTVTLKSVEVAASKAITIGNLTGVDGTITADTNRAIKDQEVTLTVTLDTAVATGKEVTVTVSGVTASSIKIAAGAKTGTTTFTMGEEDVSITATATEADASTPTTYTVNKPADVAAANGAGAYSATVSPATAAAGAEITVTVTCTTAPTDGTDTVTLTGTGIGTVTSTVSGLEANGTGTLKFTMPAADVEDLALKVTHTAADSVAVTAGDATVTLASTKDVSTYDKGMVAPSATVEIKDTAITVTLKSGGNDVADNDTIEFTLTKDSSASIEAATGITADGKVTLTRSSGAWGNVTVKVTNGSNSATYTVSVTEASTTVSISATSSGGTAKVGTAEDGAATVSVTLGNDVEAKADATVTFTVSADGTGVTLQNPDNGKETVDVTLKCSVDSSTNKATWTPDKKVVAVAPAGNTVEYTFTVADETGTTNQ